MYHDLCVCVLVQRDCVMGTVPLRRGARLYVYVKRDVCICQKRRMYMSKETYIYVKRDLCICQKRRMYMSKETYVYVKRDVWFEADMGACPAS